MSYTSVLTLSFFLLVVHVSLSEGSIPNLGGLEAQRVRVASNAIIDLEDPERSFAKRKQNEGLDTFQTSVQEPQRDPTYDPDESSWESTTNENLSLNGHGTNAHISGSNFTYMSGSFSVPSLPTTIRRKYGQILYASFYLSNSNLTLQALLSYPTAPDGDYTGAAVWTFAGYVSFNDAALFQTYSFPVVQGDTISAVINSNGRVHSIIGTVSGRQVFNFTVILTTNLNYAGVGTQVQTIGGCSELPSGHVQYFEDINLKSNGAPLDSYNWVIDNTPKVCNSTIVCCSQDCLAYWNNPKTDLTCPQVRALYGTNPTSTATLPPRSTPTTSPTSTTSQPTTVVPTTNTPTTAGPTTVLPTTAGPTTSQPTTKQGTLSPRAPCKRGATGPTGVTNCSGASNPTGDTKRTGASNPTGDTKPSGKSNPTGKTEKTGQTKATGKTGKTGPSN